jgi:very-short-patch-repair endonuclease
MGVRRSKSKQSMQMKRINPVSTERARELRSDMTDAEQKIWQVIRGEQIKGHKFRRQYVIGSYIADFVCVKEKLVIELDGGQHQDQMEYDEKRTSFLQAQGWRVLRFWNNDVMGNTSAVLTCIADALIDVPPS